MKGNYSAKAVIWDLDGVIVDTAQLHFRAWRFAFRSQNIGYTYEDFRHTFGQRNDAIIKAILGANVKPEIVSLIAKEKEERFCFLMAESVEPLPGAIALLKSLYRSNIPMALASSAPLQNIKLILNKLKIHRYFSLIISEEDVSAGKPDPQAFLLAAAKLGMEPQNCLVIEDAVAGVVAAKKAGMKCIAVTTTHSPKSLSEADLIVDSLIDVNIETIKSLWLNIKL